MLPETLLVMAIIICVPLILLTSLRTIASNATRATAHLNYVVTSSISGAGGWLFHYGWVLSEPFIRLAK